jgi:hypothetical protein
VREGAKLFLTGRHRPPVEGVAKFWVCLWWSWNVEQSPPITTYAMSYFLQARLAARRMVANKSGVIVNLTMGSLDD